MRLTPQEQTAIRKAVQQADAQATVYLFGSRVDDAARGGDIDLLVISSHINLMAQIDILTTLHQHLGDRKIDLLIYPDTTHPFPKLILKEAVKLSDG